MTTNLLLGDAVDVFKDVHGLNSIVSDPPGGGNFMQMAFDRSHGGRDAWIKYWAERFRVAREATERGSWGLFWSFPRTSHWTGCALDDAGWDVVGSIKHIHGQGWPKGRSQLKPAAEIWFLVRWGGVTPLQIDRCRVRRSGGVPIMSRTNTTVPGRSTSGATSGATGTGEYSDAGSWPPDLVLSHCPACVEVGARKVRGQNPQYANEGRGNTGMFKPGSRPAGVGIGFGAPDGTETIPAWQCLAACSCGLASLAPAGGAPSPCPGCGEERWWACPVAELDGQSGETRSGGSAGVKYDAPQKKQPGWGNLGVTGSGVCISDSGGASRFYPTFCYDAKASKAERQAGCEGLLWVRDKHAPIGWRSVDQAEYDASAPADRASGNVHATIKPVGAGDEDGLMRWLVRLITPPGGRVGDITLGSGSTAVASQIEGHPFTGSDIDPGALAIARARCALWTPERHRLELAGTIARREQARRKAEEERAAAERRGQIDLFGGRS